MMPFAAMDDMKQLIEKYLRGDATLQERELVKSWYETDPAFGDWWERELRNSGMAMDNDVQQRIYAAIIHKHCEESAPQKRTIWHKTFFLTVAAAAVTAAIAVGATLSMTRPDAPSAQPMMLATEAGNRSEITLPDGSVVTLNACSTLGYEYDSAQGCRVAHIEGEAYFEIAPDKEHPFVVVADEVKVHCVGTEFNVRAYADDEFVDVTLNDGMVSVVSKYTSHNLQPGMKASYNKVTGQLRKSRVTPEHYNAWTQGQLRFNDEPLENIARAISRTYGVKVIIETPGLDSQRYTGTLARGSIDAALATLVSASDLNCRYLPDESIVYISSNND